MKYGSKRSYNKRYYKSNSKRNYKKNPTTRTLNKKIKKMQKQQELKYNDNWKLIKAAADPSATLPLSLPVLLNGITLGTSAIDRIGSSVTATSLSFRGFLYVPNLQNIDNEDDLSRVPLVRMIIFWDESARDVPTIMGEPFSSQETLLDKATGADTIFCPYNRSTRNRFKILYDKVYKFPVQPLITTGGMAPTYTEVLPNRYVQGKVKLNRIVQYSGNTDGIQDIARNALWCVCISTYDTKVGPPDDDYFIQANICFRFNYKDD